MEDLVSIIMPTYNCEKFIAESIESVINQTYTNWEILIVDDCSTDNTKDVVKKYQKKYNNINYIVLKKNSGAAIARNLAIKKAKGRYIAFLDSDDIWYPNKLEEQIKFMKDNKYYFSYTNYIEIDENSNNIGIIVSGPKKISKKGMYCYCWPGCLTVVYDKTYIGDIQIADIKKNNDYAMWILVSQKADCYLLNETLAKYRRGRKGSISTHSYRKLIKWHYILWRTNGKNIFVSIVQTLLNLIFGFIKKIKYVKKRFKMDRNSIIYKIRRKIQTFAFYIIPNDKLSKLYYKTYLHEDLNIKEPKTFNEKLQWYKLYYCPNNSLVVQCSDKYQVREYIEKKGYKNLLSKLVGVWENGNDIDWDKLPNKFVLKCTHGCAYNIICKDKSKLDKKKTIKQLNKWLKEDFSKFNVELHYGKIKPRRIICEEYLGDKIIDYKFFCFNGKPEFYYVSEDLIHDRQAKMGFFNIDGSKLPLIRDDYDDIGEIDKPKCLNEMIEVAKKLSNDFPFVRVDFFLLGDNFRFAELTFTPAAGMMPINPKKYNLEWGELIKLQMN